MVAPDRRPLHLNRQPLRHLGVNFVSGTLFAKFSSPVPRRTPPEAGFTAGSN